MADATSTALRTQQGVRVGFTLCIEGYEKIIADAGPDELQAVSNAYEETEWGNDLSAILSGLKSSGSLRRHIDLIQKAIDAPSLAFEIQPDQDDTFGTAVHKFQPSFRSQLTLPFEPAADGSGTITVKSSAAFPASGAVYIGNKRVRYTSKPSGTTFDVPNDAANEYSPFGTEGRFQLGTNNFTHPHTLPSGTPFDKATDSWVQDVPQTWIGRRVALFCHRILGSGSSAVWDNVHEDAELKFVGRITNIEDDIRTGSTIVSCVDLAATISRATLLRGQWTGYLKKGIRLVAGDKVLLGEQVGGTFTRDYLEVVASGASGTDEINEGYYELGAFVSRINVFAANSATLNARWSLNLASTEHGIRFALTAKFSSSADRHVAISAPLHILQFLGWSPDTLDYDESKVSPHTDGWIAFSERRTFTSISFTSPGPPYRVMAIQNDRDAQSRETKLEFDSTSGTFIDHSDFLPSPYDQGAVATSSFVRIGEALMFARSVGASEMTVSPPISFAGYAVPPPGILGLTVDDPGDTLEVLQVVLLAGTFGELVPRLFASTGGGHNGDYDEFPTAMGCPGLPWSLLGDDFVNDCKAVDQGLKGEPLLIRLDRPMRMADVLLPELSLRFAWLVWKNGGYRLVCLPTPNAIAAEHTLDADTEVAPHDNKSLALPKYEITEQFLRNVIKIDFARDSGDKYQRHIVARDEASISEYDGARPLTIEAPNSFSDAASTGAAVEDLASSVIARYLPMIGRPLRLMRRTIPHTLSHIACGDTCVVSNDYVRDPTTGRRGLSSRAAIILEVTHDPSYGHEGGQPYGDVLILIGDEDRTYPLAPAAEVDTTYSGTVDGITFANGYAATAAGGPALKLVTHAYSRSTDPVDASRWANSDLVRIYEIDPADPASIDAWNRTLAASGAVDSSDSYIKLTADISAPAWSGATKLFRVVPQLYSAVQASQKLAAYLADDADGLIENAAQPNLYGEMVPSGPFVRSDGTDLATLIAEETDDEGRSFHAGLMSDFIAGGNNLRSYSSTFHTPMFWHFSAGGAPYNDTTGYTLAMSIPYPLGGILHVGARRKLQLTALLRIANGAQTVSVRVTSSSHSPLGAAGSPPIFPGIKQQVTFTYTGSTSATETALQELSVVQSSGRPGDTWLSVEIKSSSAGVLAELLGFPRFYLGPIT